jgi:DnaJ homologue, subfamily C, member 28, conserved domain
MTSWYESLVDRQIREAQERGDFDNLPGAGKPLPGIDGKYDENWWLNELVRREDIHGGVPATLALRKEVEELPETILQKKTEWSVRKTVNNLNERILRARRGLIDGPPVILATFDVEDVVRIWWDAKAGPAATERPA